MNASFDELVEAVNVLVQVVNAQKQELAQLKRDMQHVLTMKQGPKGEAGRDGRDGRDARQISVPRLMAMLRNTNRQQAPQPIHVEVQSAVAPIVVQPSEVTLEATMPTPVIENHVHVEGLSDVAESQRELAGVLAKPVRSVFDDKGRVIGGERVDRL